MKYEKVYPRSWVFNCAMSGMHPNWSFDNAHEFALIAQSLGIEPWQIFPGTRQVMMETYDSVTSYQISLLAEAIQKTALGKKVAKVWTAGQYIIYINYIGGVDDELAAKLPEFEVNNVLQHLVSDEVVTVTEVGDNYYTIRESSGYTYRVSKSIIKCGYKLKKKR